MKFCSWVIFVFSLLQGPSAHAQLWQGAKNLTSGKSALGLHLQVYGPVNSLSYKTMTFGQFSYGITDQFGVETRLGLGNPGYSLSALGKIQLFSNSFWAVGILTGLELYNYLSLDMDFLASLSFFEDYLEIYSSIHFFLPLEGSAIGLGIIPGLGFRISPWIKLYLEGNLDLANYDTAISLGFRAFF